MSTSHPFALRHARLAVSAQQAPIIVAILACLVAGGRHLRAGESPGNEPTAAICRFATGRIEIDGQADDSDWEHAPWIEGFAKPWLRDQAQPPGSPTRAKLLWDRENLYFFAEMEDHDLFADVTEHDGRTWSNDVFELFLKPSREAPAYYEFQVNAAGTVLDMLLPSRQAQGYEKFKADGNFHLETKVVRRGTLNRRADRDTGWSVEGRIPWIDFLRAGGRPDPGDVWTFAMCRYDYSADRGSPDLSTSAPLASKPYPDFHLWEDYAPLQFAGPHEEATADEPSWQFRPTESRVVGSPDPPPPYRAREAYPELEFRRGIGIVAQPGTNRMLGYTLGSGSGGEIIRFVDSPDASQVETLLETDDQIYGAAFHPRFEENRYVFIGANGPAIPPATGRHTRVWRYTLAGEGPGTFDPNSRLLVIEWPSDGHNGGDVTFGHDGMLYVTSGDGTGDSDTDMRGQGLDHLLAKVLRIDVDHPANGKQYSVPEDNPFVDTPGARPETWAYGLRNPWKITTDRETGHIWVGNNGQDLWEQAYLVRRGDNYGWSTYEGSHIFYANREMGPTPLVEPTVEHPHSEARSLTGGVVYYGSQLPELTGAYIYGDYSTGKVWAVRHDGNQVTFHQEIADTSLEISGFGVNTRGELLVIDHGPARQGAIYLLEPNTAVASDEFPRRLSETGLFTSVAGHRVADSLIPYTVNAPQWADGAYQLRYIALPDAESKVDIAGGRGWNLPDGTVLVKSLAIEERPGNAASRRWIETQLLTRQQGEWVGYTYEWDESGTDAQLVDRGGADRTYPITTPAGTLVKPWRFHSRTECMVCHSRAANFVLGLSTPQMNRPVEPGRALENPLAVLERLGVLRVDWSASAAAEHRRLAQDAAMTDEQIAQYMAKHAPSGAAAQYSTLLTGPLDAYPHLVDPYDEAEDLAARARSYLHANCAACHVAAGGGNAAMELEFSRALSAMNVVDVQPLHDAFDIDQPRLIAPGAPERSVLLHRMMIRGRGQMPQLGTLEVDQRAVTLLREWIASLAPSEELAE